MEGEGRKNALIPWFELNLAFRTAFGLSLDEQLVHGTSGRCSTFNNDSLVPDSESNVPNAEGRKHKSVNRKFDVGCVEVWQLNDE